MLQKVAAKVNFVAAALGWKIDTASFASTIGDLWDFDELSVDFLVSCLFKNKFTNTSMMLGTS